MSKSSSKSKKQQGLSPLQITGLHELGDIYIKHFATAIKNENSANMKSTNGANLQYNLKLYGLSHQRFFSSLEKRIVREFDNVKDAHFDYELFLSSGIYILHLTYVGNTAASKEVEIVGEKRTTKLSRNSYPALFKEYELGKKFRSNEISAMDILQSQFEETPNPAETLARISRDYCRSLGLAGLNEQERLEAFIEYQHKVLSNIYGPFYVEIVAPSFSQSMDSIEIPASIEWKKLYDLFGECSGILVFPEGIMEYAITKDGDYMRFIYNDYRKGRIVYSFEDSFFRSLPDDEYKEFFIKALDVLIVKKYGKVETLVIEGKGRSKVGKNYIVNKAPFPIHRLDGAWLKTIIRTNGFDVKGHFRLQACGKGWKERKLVYIKPFQKRGYVRVAPALSARASA